MTSLIQALWERCHRSPGDIALVDGEGEHDYRTVFAKAFSLAAQLRAITEADRTPGRAWPVVGLSAARNADSISAILGIMFADAVYLPLDPGLPDAHLRHLTREAAPVAVVTDRSGAAALGDLPVKTVPVAEETGPQKVPSACPRVDTGKPAYLLFTSGSSGTAKGVLGSYRGLENRIGWMRQAYPYRPGDRCCQRTPFTFVDSLCEIFAPLTNGVPSVVIDDATVRDPEGLPAALAAHRITHVTLVPALLRTLLASPGADRALGGLRYCAVSGEALPKSVALDFSTRFPGCALLNYYGSTEVAADVTVHRVNRSDAGRPSIPIGTPLPGVEIRLLRDDLSPVDPGEVGEIFVLSDVAVAHGYLGGEPEGRRRFLVNDFAPDSGERAVFRTGDLGYALDDVLYYAGRADLTYKLHGRKVNPYAVERYAPEAPVVLRDVMGHPRLVGFYAGEQTEEEIRERLSAGWRAARQGVPDYAIPKLYARLDALPRTTNGKVDRQALQRMEMPPLRLAHDRRILPRDAVERRVSQLLAGYLGVDGVGLDLTFFDAGGTSVDVPNVVGLLNRHFTRQLSVAEFHREPTVEGLARSLRAAPSAERVLTALVRGRPDRNLVLIHPAGGLSFSYASLERGLGDWTVLGVNAPEFGSRKTYSSVTELARRYLAVIAERVPSPAVIGGWSFGGTVAFEIARRALAEDIPLKGLILIDTHTEHESATGGSLAERQDYLIRNGIDPSSPLGRDLLREMLFHDTLEDAHTLGPLDLEPVFLLKATADAGHDPCNGWRRFLPRGVHVLHVEGEHDYLFDPWHIDGVAAALRHALERLD